MRILFFANWKVQYWDSVPFGLQPSDYACPQESFWFFKYFSAATVVDVVDISAPGCIFYIENKLRFHIFQTVKVLSKLNQYDLIFIHGSNSAMLLGVLKRVLHVKIPPMLVVDISSFHQCATRGLIYRLSRFSSRAFDYLLYHTSSQFEYYKQEYPWLKDKSRFIPLGVDVSFWKGINCPITCDKDSYIVCVGYRKRDWNTLISAYNASNIKEKLYLIGNKEIKTDNANIRVIPFIPLFELMSLIVNARYSVLPLDDFNYSFAQLTLLQQMAIGVPVITADVPAVRDYVRECNGVLLYRAYQIDDLVEKLKTLSNCSKDKLKEMGQHNMETVAQLFSEQQMAQRMETLCGEIVNDTNVNK